MPFSILPLHLLTLTFVVVTIILADHEALAWMRGKKETLDLGRIQKLHRRMWLGLALMIVTGLVMFWPARDYLMLEPLFRLKIFFIFCLVLNGLFVGQLMQITATRSYASLSTKEKIPIFATGAVSTISWLGATGAALLLFGWQNFML